MPSLVGSEMCIRDSGTAVHGCGWVGRWLSPLFSPLVVLQRCGSWPYVLLRYVRFLGSISVRLKKFFVHRCSSLPLLSIIRLSTSCRYGSSYITTSFFVCPVKHRLSRPPPDTPRPRDHATTTPRGSPMYHRRKIGRQRRTRRAGSVERCSWGRAYLLPVMAGAHKNMEIPCLLYTSPSPRD